MFISHKTWLQIRLRFSDQEKQEMREAITERPGGFNLRITEIDADLAHKVREGLGSCITRIEFSAWPANTEVMLVEAIDGVERISARFYTACRRFGFQGLGNLDQKYRVDAAATYDALEDILPPPDVTTMMSSDHPYWRERSERMKLKAAMETHGLGPEPAAEPFSMRKAVKSLFRRQK
jgi:hypothetical protein